MLTQAKAKNQSLLKTSSENKLQWKAIIFYRKWNIDLKILLKFETIDKIFHAFSVLT